MNFIRKIAEGKNDVWVKKQFTRYGRGNYKNKALLMISKGGKRAIIKSTFEFAGEFAYELANSIEGKVPVTGGMISTKDLSEDVDFEFAGKKQFAGVKTFLIDMEMSKEDIQGLYDKFPSTLIFLTFKTEEGQIKTKVKSPKAAKPKKGETEPKADFCNYKTTNNSVVDDLTFDVEKEFKKVRLSHSFEISDLEIPEEYKNDFAQARVHAIRKGKLIREITINEEKEEKEYDLEV